LITVGRNIAALLRWLILALLRRLIFALLWRLVLALLGWLVTLRRLLIVLRVRKRVVALPIELNRRC
jgi:hypothetical protein